MTMFVLGLNSIFLKSGFSGYRTGITVNNRPQQLGFKSRPLFDECFIFQFIPPSSLTQTDWLI